MLLMRDIISYRIGLINVKKVTYTLVLLISMLLLTGCGEQTYKFESSEIIYEFR